MLLDPSQQRGKDTVAGNNPPGRPDTMDGSTTENCVLLILFAKTDSIFFTSKEKLIKTCGTKVGKGNEGMQKGKYWNKAGSKVFLSGRERVVSFGCASALRQGAVAQKMCLICCLQIRTHDFWEVWFCV